MSKNVTNPAYYLANSSTPAVGGTGYTVGSVLQVNGGVATTPAQITVSVIGIGGALIGFTVSQGGNYQTLPSNPVSLSTITGAGSGAQLTAIWVPGQPGYTPILLYGSNTAGVTPPLNTLKNRELFINIPDRLIYTLSTTNSLVVLGGGGYADSISIVFAVALG